MLTHGREANLKRAMVEQYNNSYYITTYQQEDLVGNVAKTLSSKDKLKMVEFWETHSADS